MTKNKITLLKNAGVSDTIAREIIGHDSEALNRVYTHIEPETLRAAAVKMSHFTSAPAPRKVPK
jgi:site-specific recombinase XerD